MNEPLTNRKTIDNSIKQSDFRLPVFECTVVPEKLRSRIRSPFRIGASTASRAEPYVHETLCRTNEKMLGAGIESLEHFNAGFHSITLSCRLVNPIRRNK